MRITFLASELSSRVPGPLGGYLGRSRVRAWGVVIWGALILALWAAGPAQGAEIFRDVAAESGLDYLHFNGASGELYYVEITSPGGAWFDYDNDGDLDVYVVQGEMLGGKTFEQAVGTTAYPKPLTDRLYRNDLKVNDDGTRSLEFTDVTQNARLAPSTYGMGVATGDFDNDGWTDLYITNLGANNFLKNNGDGTFTDITESTGTNDPRWSISSTFFDYDRDGWLDLFVVNYVDFIAAKHKLCPSPTGARDYCGPLAYKPVVDRLFRNRGDGTFEDVSTKAKINVDARTGLGVVAADFDRDGWLDLYVANDGTSNQLYLNEHDGTFRDDTVLAGAAVNAEGKREASMGVDAADFNQNGYDDLFMTHLTGETNTLYVNSGGAMFSDETQTAGLGTPSWRFTAFGTRFFDYDNDGWLDLITVNGAVAFFATGRRLSLDQTNQLFRNIEGQRFDEVSATAGEVFKLSEVSRGAAFGDVDNDGDVDVLVLNNAGPARLLLNEVGSSNGWLGVRAVDPKTSRDQLGSQVTLIRSDAPPLRRRIQTDGSYASASDPRVIFGLGQDSAAAYSVQVDWSDGQSEIFPDLTSGRYHLLEKGRGKASIK